MADVLSDYDWSEFLNKMLLTKQLLELEALEDRLSQIVPRDEDSDVKECNNCEAEQLDLNLISQKFDLPDGLSNRHIKTCIQMKKDVYIHCHMIKLGEIDTINEKFHSELIIYSRWVEPMLKENKQKWLEGKFDAWEDYWNPRLTISNPFNSLTETTRYQILEIQNEMLVEEVRYVKGLFAETLELQDYPFDEQELCVRLSSELPESELSLLCDDNQPSLLNVDSFSDRQQWRLDEGLRLAKADTKCDLFAEKAAKHPVLHISCTVTRKSQFFIWNIIVIMICICSLAFSVFTISFDVEYWRLNLSFILLLSIITFKTVVSKTIPKVSYLTFMDKYIYVSMCVIISMIVWHALMLQLRQNRELAAPLDKIMLAILASAYIIFNVICVVNINCCTAASRNKKKSKIHPQDNKNKIV